MSIKTIRVSDLTGEEINGKSAQIRIFLESKPKTTYLLDANEQEVAGLIAKATEHHRKGRPRKS